MPKDEFDIEDPLELNGVAFMTEEDTSTAMAECFVEEFMLMGSTRDQILGMFRNPHYIGMNMVLQNKGERFVREIIGKTFAAWGRSSQRASEEEKDAMDSQDQAGSSSAENQTVRAL